MLQDLLHTSSEALTSIAFSSWNDTSSNNNTANVKYSTYIQLQSVSAFGRALHSTPLHNAVNLTSFHTSNFTNALAVNVTTATKVVMKYVVLPPLLHSVTHAVPQYCLDTVHTLLVQLHLLQ